MREVDELVLNFVREKKFAHITEMRDELKLTRNILRHAIDKLYGAKLIFRIRQSVYAISPDIECFWPCKECGELGVTNLNYTNLCPKCLREQTLEKRRKTEKNGTPRIRRPREFEPCVKCGSMMKKYRNRKTPPYCESCKKALIFCCGCGVSRKFKNIETHMCVDWLAIEQAIDNKSSSRPLNSRELSLLARRFADKIWVKTTLPPFGFFTSSDLALWANVPDSSMVHAIFTLPNADKHVCPSCDGTCWVISDTGLVEDHANGYLNRCKISGMRFSDFV